jgi:hypothetical protein
MTAAFFRISFASRNAFSSFRKRLNSSSRGRPCPGKGSNPVPAAARWFAENGYRWVYNPDPLAGIWERTYLDGPTEEITFTAGGAFTWKYGGVSGESGTFTRTPRTITFTPGAGQYWTQFEMTCETSANALRLWYIGSTPYHNWGSFVRH